MDTKLTLKLDQEIIEKAKNYATSKKISLSRLIESYLQSLTIESQNQKEMGISKFVKSISSEINLPADYDYKKDRAAYLEEKYK